MDKTPDTDLAAWLREMAASMDEYEQPESATRYRQAAEAVEREAGLRELLRFLRKHLP